jgi:hypothetical protein
MEHAEPVEDEGRIVEGRVEGDKCEKGLEEREAGGEGRGGETRGTVDLWRKGGPFDNVRKGAFLEY